MIHTMETNNEKEVVLNEEMMAYAIHPGSVLQDELKSRGIRQKDFAKSIGMEATHLSAIIHGVRNITAAIAAKLEAGLGISAKVWLNLQNDYNLNKRRLEGKRTSSLVSGYGPAHIPYTALRETDMVVRVAIPYEDKALLLDLAEKFGWTCRIDLEKKVGDKGSQNQ